MAYRKEHSPSNEVRQYCRRELGNPDTSRARVRELLGRLDRMGFPSEKIIAWAGEGFSSHGYCDPDTRRIVLHPAPEQSEPPKSLADVARSLTKCLRSKISEPVLSSTNGRIYFGDHATLRSSVQDSTVLPVCNAQNMPARVNAFVRKPFVACAAMAIAEHDGNFTGREDACFAQRNRAGNLFAQNKAPIKLSSGQFALRLGAHLKGGPGEETLWPLVWRTQPLGGRSDSVCAQSKEARRLEGRRELRLREVSLFLMDRDAVELFFDKPPGLRADESTQAMAVPFSEKARNDFEVFIEEGDNCIAPILTAVVAKQEFRPFRPNPPRRAN